MVGEGNDYSPIQQSYEIRKLRAENQRLKERLQAAKLPHSGDEDDEGDSGEQTGSRTAIRAAATRQRRFKTSDRTDNLYFGTPGLANIINDVSLTSMVGACPTNMPTVRQLASGQPIAYTHNAKPHTQGTGDVCLLRLDVPIPYLPGLGWTGHGSHTLSRTAFT